MAITFTTSCGDQLAYANLSTDITFDRDDKEIEVTNFFKEFESQNAVQVIKEEAKKIVPKRTAKKSIQKRKINNKPLKKEIQIKEELLNEEFDLISMNESSIERDVNVDVNTVSLNQIVDHYGYEIKTEVVSEKLSELVMNITFPKFDEVKVVQSATEENKESAPKEVLLNETIQNELVAENIPQPQEVVQEEKNSQVEPIESKTPTDEIVAYDYSNNEEQAVAPEEKSVISDNVFDTLSRIYDEKKVVQIKPEDLVASNFRPATGSRTTAPSVNSQNALVQQNGIQAVKVHLNVGVDYLDNSFEYSDSIDDTEVVLANQEGKILISQKGLVNGVISSPNAYPTRIEIDNNEGMVYVPSITLQSMREVGEKYELDLFGGHVLIELSDSFDNVELDSQYSKKMYFSEKFREVSEISDARFVLFVGVIPGNTTVTYKIGNEFVSTIRLVVEDETTYESREIRASWQKQLLVDYWLPLGRTSVEESIEDLKIGSFMSDIRISKIGVNGLRLDGNRSIAGTDEYLQIESEGARYFANVSNKDKITIPTPDLNSYIFKRLNLSGLENACLVVINTEDLSQFEAVLATASGNQKLNIYSLGNNGQFNYEMDERTQKVILVGQDQGVITYRTTNSIGKKTTKKSYCSLGAYLIE